MAEGMLADLLEGFLRVSDVLTPNTAVASPLAQSIHRLTIRKINLGSRLAESG
jgi:hypothetical protein